MEPGTCTRYIAYARCAAPDLATDKLERQIQAAHRLGDQLGAWGWAALSALGLGISGISLAAVPLSAVWLTIALWLGRRMKRIQP